MATWQWRRAMKYGFVIQGTANWSFCLDRHLAVTK